jgi:ADP-heptose:LPS heptosyltransferase
MQLLHQIPKMPRLPRLPRIPAIPAQPAPIDLGSRPRICVIKLATLGDLLLATPALRALRSRYPDATVDILTTPGSADLLRDSQLIRRIYALDKYAFDTPAQMLQDIRPTFATSNLLTRLRRERYDAVLLLHHLTLTRSRIKSWTLVRAIGARYSAGLDNGWGGFLDLRVPDNGFGIRHEAEYALEVARAVGARVEHGAFPLRIADMGWEDITESVDPIQSIQSPAACTPLGALHPGSGSYSTARRYSPEHFADVARALHSEFGARVLLLGSQDEEDLQMKIRRRLGSPGWVESYITESLHDLARCLATCALFIGNDSFPMHLSTMVGVPTVAIFGPSNHHAWGPYRPDAPREVYVVRRSDLACSPCFYRGHSLGTPEGCPPRTCLTELPIERILWPARRLLLQHGWRPELASQRD